MINSELRRGGLQFRSKRVDTKESFLEEIRNDPPDLILADHGLPTFDSFTALSIARCECPNVPFIFVTGTMDAQMAINTLKGGATDYVLKSHLDRLVPSVKRALQQAEERHKHQSMESDLRESEERFRMLVDGVKDYAIFMLDPQGRITSWNTGAEWIENYHADEILGRDIACLFPESGLAAQSLEKTLQTAEREGRFEAEGWCLRKSGARFWAKTVITPLPKKGKQAQGFTVVIQDLTQRHESEETWKQYEAIVNTARDFLTLIDSGYRYVAANEAYCRAHGKSREQIVGSTVAELWGEEVFRTVIRDHLQNCFAGQDVKYQAWFEFPSLGRRFFEVNYYPYVGEDTIQYAIVVTRDITDLAQAQQVAQTLNGNLEQRVAERTEDLKAAYEELESLCYSISHDLRAPLRHIRGFVELLRQELGDNSTPECRNYVETISEASTQMGKLIDELLAFARIGRAELRPTRVNLVHLANSVKEEFNAQFQEREIEWAVGDLPQAEADPTLLRQVFVELISNAVKFTQFESEPRIEVGGTAGAEEVVIFVRDNGAGFDMTYANKLFGVFQKLHSPQQFEGTGIGLAKVRRIIQRHRGRTWAEGENGNGATFYFSLPSS